MEENKNLVISYYYHCDKKCSPKETAEEKEVNDRIQEIIQELVSNSSIDSSLSNEWEKLIRKQTALEENRIITIN